MSFYEYCYRCANKHNEEKCNKCYQKDPSQFVEIPERKFIAYMAPTPFNGAGNEE